MIHQPDHVKAIGNDLGLWEVLLDDGAVGGREIHANDLHKVFALELAQISLKRGFAAS